VEAVVSDLKDVIAKQDMELLELMAEFRSYGVDLPEVFEIGSHECDIPLEPQAATTSRVSPKAIDASRSSPLEAKSLAASPARAVAKAPRKVVRDALATASEDGRLLDALSSVFNKSPPKQAVCQ